MIYKIRVILDTKEDIFRDIEIEDNNSLEDLHKSILNACELDGNEMASFYISNEKWEQGEEITLFDVSEGMSTIKVMNKTPINEVLTEKGNKLIYVYDFLNIWTFFIDLIEIKELEDNNPYPQMVYSFGMMPTEVPEKNFEPIKNTKNKKNDIFEGDDTFDMDDMYEDGYDNWN